MHFFTVATILAAAASVSAWSSYDDDVMDLIARDFSGLLARDYNDLLDDEMFSFERRKVKLTIPKVIKGASIPQAEQEEVQRLGEAAMAKHGAKKGEVSAGWHDGGSTNSRDKNMHFDITPSDPAGAKVIHVYRNGDSTQGTERLDEARQKALDDYEAANPSGAGTKGKGGKGGGKKGKRSFDTFEAPLTRRELENVDFHYSNMLQARQLYLNSLENTFASSQRVDGVQGIWTPS